jgi:hypothetical protein
MRSHRIWLAAITAALLLPASAAHAQCVGTGFKDGDFELQRANFVNSPWVAEGKAGIEVGRGFSFRGRNNAWARNAGGWNAIRQQVRLFKGVKYTLQGYVRTSSNVRDGYFGFRNAAGQVAFEHHFSSRPKWVRMWVTFRPRTTGRHYVFAGIWGPGSDAWMRIDNLTLSFGCNDTAGHGVPGD